MAHMGSNQWDMTQLLEESSNPEDPTDDVVSSLSFNEDGSLLASGDRGGWVTLYDVDGLPKKGLGDNSSQKQLECKKLIRFRSHEPDFDYLKSLDIESKINQIKFCPSHGSTLFLTTNDKTIKLWKVSGRNVVNVASNNIGRGRNQGGSRRSLLQLPAIRRLHREYIATPRRVYANAHAYHINSISMNSDGETYLSADDLRINLWHLERSKLSFNIVDIRPANMEDLTEVITAAQFHPTQCNLLMYSSSKGSIKMFDMRERAHCDRHCKMFEEEEDPATRNFFSEIIASVSDAKLTPDGRYIISRDYLTLKIWDVNMERRPMLTINVHDHLRSRLCELYETECIFDKFEVAVSGDGSGIITGSYNNTFHIHDRYGRASASVEIATGDMGHTEGPTYMQYQDGVCEPSMLDVNNKILHTAWHPKLPYVAAATNNNVCLFGA